MARKIVITSGKGGVGKTTICANLGACLAKAGLRVVLLDVDIGLNNLDVVSGITEKVVYDIVDIIEGKCRPRQALIQDEKVPSLYYLPSAHSYNVGKATGENIKAVVDSLASSFDYILIDCPAGIELGFHRAVFGASEALIVTTPHISAVRDANKVASLLSSYEMNSIGLVVNRLRGDLVAKGEMLNENEIANALGLDLLGVVPESDELSSASSIRGEVFGIGGDAEQAFYILANNLRHGSRVMYDYISKHKGFWGRLKNGLKGRI